MAAPRVNPKLKKAYDFFVIHTGRSNALDLARAEAIAEALGWKVEWQPDEEEYQLGDAETEYPREVFNAILLSEEGETLAGLGAIGDPDRAYVRIVEADLAYVALYEMGLL